MGSGRCICKPQFSGENCERCADGYIYYPQCIRKLCRHLFLVSHSGMFMGTCSHGKRGIDYTVHACQQFFSIQQFCWLKKVWQQPFTRNSCSKLTGISLISLSKGNMQPVPSQLHADSHWLVVCSFAGYPVYPTSTKSPAGPIVGGFCWILKCQT